MECQEASAAGAGAGRGAGGPTNEEIKTMSKLHVELKAQSNGGKRGKIKID